MSLSLGWQKARCPDQTRADVRAGGRGRSGSQRQLPELNAIRNENGEEMAIWKKVYVSLNAWNWL